jgi:hypothetical protein
MYGYGAEARTGQWASCIPEAKALVMEEHVLLAFKHSGRKNRPPSGVETVGDLRGLDIPPAPSV